MIKITDLNFKYDDNIIFENARINIPKNKITMIVGPNGVGKTTLLKIISNEIHATYNIQKKYKKIFYLPQKLYYPKGVNTFDYISSVFFKDTWKWFLDKKDQEKICEFLDKLELSDRKSVLIENLSSGELQKANITLGLLSNADLFLLDEPTSNMDLINQIKILNMIKDLSKKNITTAIIMHDLSMASNYGDYFIGISHNHKITSATKKEFFSSENLNKIYGINFKVVNNEEKFYIQVFN